MKTKKARPNGVNKRNLELIKNYQKGEKEALNDLIIFNYDFISNLAKRNKKKLKPLETDDIIQDMILGLIEAAERFNTKSNCPFLSYATFWMYQVAEKDAFNNQIIKLPNEVYNKIKKKRDFNITYDIFSNDTKFFKEKVNLLEFLFYDTLSDNVDVMGESPDIDNELYLKEIMHKVFKGNPEKPGIKVLSKREREVIKLRFGLYENDPMTLEEVGKIYNVTRDRIRQIESKALLKMRRILCHEGTNTCL